MSAQNNYERPETLLLNPSLDAEEKLQLIEQLREVAKRKADEAERLLGIESDESMFHEQNHGASLPSVEEDFGKEGFHSSDFESEEETDESDNHSVASHQQHSDNESIEDESSKYVREAEQARARRDRVKEKFHWKQEHLRLAHRAQFVEREIAAILTHSKNATLREQYLEVERKRKLKVRERSQLRTELDIQLSKARTSVALVRAHVDKMGNGDQFIVKLQELIETSEGLISSMKHTSKGAFDILLQQEAEVSDEVAGVLDMVDRMERAGKQQRKLRKHENSVGTPSISRVPKYRSRTTIQKNGTNGNNNEFSIETVQQAVENIDQEMAGLGGSTGHWDARDHASFLQVMSRFKLRDALLHRYYSKTGHNELTDDEMNTINRFIAKAASVIPMQDPKSIASHLEWYSRYQDLVERKREAVSKWRKLKVSVKDRTSRQDENSDRLGNTNTAKLREQRKKELKLKQEKRRAVQQWKAEKATRKRIEAERKQNEDARQRQAKLEAKLERDKVKEQIQLYRLEQERIQRLQDSKKSTSKHNLVKSDPRKVYGSNGDNTAAKPTKQQLEALRERDNRIVQKRIADRKKLTKQTREEQIASLIAPGAPKVSRDSNRITRPTRANLGHRLTEEEIHEMKLRRTNGNAHDSVVPSTFGVERSGRGYGIGVRHMLGHVARKPASWRTGR